MNELIVHWPHSLDPLETCSNCLAAWVDHWTSKLVHVEGCSIVKVSKERHIEKTPSMNHVCLVTPKK